MEEKSRFAKREYQQQNEHDKSNEELKPSELNPSRIAYATVVKTTLENLSTLKRDLEECFEKHDAEVVYQKASVGYLEIIEQPCWTKEEREAHLGLKKERP